MVNKQWRPVGFRWDMDRYKNIKQVLDNQRTSERDIDIGIYEAGADAMLKALRGEGYHFDRIPDNVSSISIPVFDQNIDGTVVFIPDEVKDGKANVKNGVCSKGGYHEWGYWPDGCHYNEFCLKCFKDKPKNK